MQNATFGPRPAWRVWLATVTVALMPLSLNLGYYILRDRKALNFSPLDVLAPVLVLLLLWDIWKGRTREWTPPLPNLAWAVLALASLAWASGVTLGEWARTAVFQTTLIVLCAVWVFRHVAADAKSYRRLALVLGASVGVCFLYALYQYLQPRGLPLPSGQVGRYYGGGVTDVRVAGWYEYRAQLAAQVAMLAPAAAAFAALDRDPLVRIVAGAFAALGLCVCLYGGGVLAAGAGILGVAGVLLVLPRLVPLSADSGPQWRALSADSATNPEGQARQGWSPARKGALLIAALLLLGMAILPRLPRGNPQVLWRTLSGWVEAREGDPAAEVPSARLRRSQAAWNLLGHHDLWRTGVGAGGYEKISGFYPAAYPKLPVATDSEALFDREVNEPLTHSQLETTAVELGLPGVVLLVCVFGAWVAAAGAALWRAGPDQVEQRVLALAALGAGVGALVFCLFGSPLARGAGGTCAFFMGVALALNARSAPQLKAPR